MNDLTPRQRRFVEAYAGNGTEAAIAAGYSPRSATEQASRLLNRPAVAEAVRGREAAELEPIIANRRQRQQFWSDTMRDTAEDIKVRLKASELLAKSEGDFLDRVEVTARANLAEKIREGRRRALLSREETSFLTGGDEPTAAEDSSLDGEA